MLQPRRNCSAIVLLFAAFSLHAQIRQSDNLRAEQAVAEQRLQQQTRQEEQQHQAQVQEMQRVDRQQEREQQELNRQRELQAEAAQQALIQQQAQQSARQQQQQKTQNVNSVPVAIHSAQAPPAAGLTPQPTPTPQWSLRNFTLRDEIGLAALGLLLGALAFKAGNPRRNRS